MKTLDQQLQAFQELVATPSANNDAVSGHIHLYQYAYPARLREALQANYPAFFAAVGDDLFEEIANAYIDTHPSYYRSIRWYGTEFVSFLTQSNLIPHPAMIDIAKIDWAMDSAFDAQNTPLLAIEDLTCVAPEAWSEFRFILHPSVQILTLDWQVAKTWQTLAEDQHANTPNPEKNHHHLLIWREELEPKWREIEALEMKLLQEIQRQQTFADLCEMVATHENDEEGLGIVVQYLQTWIAAGVLSKN